MNKLWGLMAAGLAAAAVAVALPALAQSYPSKAIRLVSPFPPGGSVDVVGRLSGAFIIGFPGNTALVQVYDPATDSWATKAPMPTPRSGLNTAQLNGIIYAAGGEVQDQQYLAAFKAFEAYDPESDTWWQLPSMLLPRHECIMAAVGNRIHVAGGSVQSAIVPPPRGVSFDTDAHEAFEVASS